MNLSRVATTLATLWLPSSAATHSNTHQNWRNKLKIVCCVLFCYKVNRTVKSCCKYAIIFIFLDCISLHACYRSVSMFLLLSNVLFFKHYNCYVYISAVFACALFCGRFSVFLPFLNQICRFKVCCCDSLIGGRRKKGGQDGRKMAAGIILSLIFQSATLGFSQRLLKRLSCSTTSQSSKGGLPF